MLTKGMKNLLRLTRELYEKVAYEPPFDELPVK